MDYNDTYAGEFSYHNITRSQESFRFLKEKIYWLEVY